MNRFSYMLGSLLAMLSLLCSCESAVIPELDNEITYDLDIHVSDFDVTYLDFKSRTQTNNSRRISFAALNQDNDIVFTTEQIEDSIADFGKINCQLTSGTYTLIAVVHQSSQQADISYDKISFLNDSITDTFLATQTIVLSDESPLTEIDMKAHRAVSMFRLTCRDELPRNIKSFSVVITKGGEKLDPRTGFSVNDKSHKYAIIINPSDKGEKDYSFSIFSFLNSNEVNADITVTAISMDGEEMKTVSFQNIKLGINKRTDAQGAFFVQKQSLGISYDTEWADTEVIDF